MSPGLKNVGEQEQTGSVLLFVIVGGEPVTDSRSGPEEWGKEERLPVVRSQFATVVEPSRHAP